MWLLTNTMPTTHGRQIYPLLHTFTVNKRSLSVASRQRNPTLSSTTSIHSPFDSAPIDRVPHTLSTTFIHSRLRSLLTHGIHDNVHPLSRRSFVHPTVTPSPSRRSPAAQRHAQVRPAVGSSPTRIGRHPEVGRARQARATDGRGRMCGCCFWRGSALPTGPGLG